MREIGFTLKTLQVRLKRYLSEYLGFGILSQSGRIELGSE